METIFEKLLKLRSNESCSDRSVKFSETGNEKDLTIEKRV